MILFLITVLLGFIFFYDILRYNKHKTVCYNLLLIILILISGLRYRIGIDSLSYEMFFNSLPALYNLNFDNFVSYEPLFVIFLASVKTIFNSWVVVQLIHAAFINTVAFYFIKKWTNFWFIGALIYFVWLFYVNNCEEMRQSISGAILLLSIDSLLKRRLILYYVLFSIACLFHRSFIFFFFLPMVMTVKTNHLLSYAIFSILFLIGEILREKFTMMNSIDHLAYFNETLNTKLINYSNSRYSEKVILSFSNYLNFILSQVAIYLFTSHYLRKHKASQIKLEPFLFIYFIVAILSFRFIMFYRYIHYLAFFPIIYLSEALGYSGILHLRKKSLKEFLIFICLLIFFFIPRINSFFRYDDDGRTKRYSRFYPYYSVLSNRKDIDRERFYMYMN